MKTITRNNIKVKEVKIENNIIEVDYEISKELEQFFDMTNKFRVQ